MFPPKQGVYPAGPLQEPTSELKYTEELNGMLERAIILDSVTVAEPIKWPLREIATIAPASATQITSSNMTVVRFPLLCDIPSPFSLPPIKLYTLKSELSAHRTTTEADETLTSDLAATRSSLCHVEFYTSWSPCFLLLNLLSIVTERKKLFK
jgi:hypothetical protein